jgi:hypothetical protein
MPDILLVSSFSHFIHLDSHSLSCLLSPLHSQVCSCCVLSSLKTVPSTHSFHCLRSALFLCLVWSPLCFFLLSFNSNSSLRFISRSTGVLALCPLQSQDYSLHSQLSLFKVCSCRVLSSLKTVPSTHSFRCLSLLAYRLLAH